MSLAAKNARRLSRARAAFFGAAARRTEMLDRAESLRVAPDFGALRWLTLLALALFLIQVLTGVLLSLYYYPVPSAAYASVRFIGGQDVPAGWLVRSIHRYAGELLLVSMLAHLAIAFAKRAYAKPNALAWVAGVLLLVVVAAFRFTGSLLPYDAVALASVSRALDVLGSIPLLGSVPAAWLRGGEALGANALSRFYTTHAMVLPWIGAALLLLNLGWLKKSARRVETRSIR